MTLAAFLARFPEFQRASSELITACLSDAAARAGAGSGAWWTLKIGFLAAHYVAMSPGGRELRQAPEDGANGSPYLTEYLDLCAQEGTGPWVA